jgi:hypothetical protein
VHTTNYTSAFIAVADDCRAAAGTVPPEKAEPTLARMQFELLHEHPYQYTSDELLFSIYAARRRIPESECEAARAAFFAQGQPCLRSSPLAKTYGWGFHFDQQSRIAIYPLGSDDYERLRSDRSLRQLKAMRSAK